MWKLLLSIVFGLAGATEPIHEDTCKGMPTLQECRDCCDRIMVNTCADPCTVEDEWDQLECDACKDFVTAECRTYACMDKMCVPFVTPLQLTAGLAVTAAIVTEQDCGALLQIACESSTGEECVMHCNSYAVCQCDANPGYPHCHSVFSEGCINACCWDLLLSLEAATSDAIEPFCTPGPTCLSCCIEWGQMRCGLICQVYGPLHPYCQNCLTREIYTNCYDIRCADPE